jgi:hypothetical protein
MTRIARFLKLSLFLLIFSGYIVFVSGVSHSEDLVLQPGPEGKDAYVNGLTGASTNDGGWEWFKGIGLISYYAAFIEFDLSSIPMGSTINSATITLWARYYDGQIFFRPVISAWEEMSITWDNQPSTGPPEVSYPISRGLPDGPCYWGCTWDFDITTIIQYCIDNSNFGVKIAANTPGIGWLMASSDNLTYPKPKLTVEYSMVGVGQNSWGAIKCLYR